MTGNFLTIEEFRRDLLIKKRTLKTGNNELDLTAAFIDTLYDLCLVLAQLTTGILSLNSYMESDLECNQEIKGLTKCILLRLAAQQIFTPDVRDIITDQVNTDQVNTDQVNTDQVNTDQVNTDQVNTEMKPDPKNENV